MTKELSGRQAIIIVAIVACATKFFILPSNLTAQAGQDAIYLMFFFIVAEFLLFLCLVQISKLNEDKTLYELLQETLGVGVAKAIFLVFFVFFTCKLCINIIETYTFFLGTLYDELSPLMYFFPIAMLIFYMTSIGLKAIGRSAEVLWVFVFIGIVLMLAVSLPSVDFAYMLPIFENGGGAAESALLKNSLWFGDYFVYLFFFGKIKFKKGFCRRMATIVAVTILAIVFFIVVFHCAFPHTAGMRHYAISDISQQTSRITTLGKVDWLVVVVWSFASVIQTVIFAYCAEESLGKIFNIKQKYVSSLILVAILGVVLFVLKFQIVNLLSVVQSPLSYLSGLLLIISFLIIAAHFISRAKSARASRGALCLAGQTSAAKAASAPSEASVTPKRTADESVRVEDNNPQQPEQTSCAQQNKEKSKNTQTGGESGAGEGSYGQRDN